LKFPGSGSRRNLRARRTFEGEFSEVTRSCAGKGVARYGWQFREVLVLAQSKREARTCHAVASGHGADVRGGVF
jgi:hypothetical protein